MKKYVLCIVLLLGGCDTPDATQVMATPHTKSTDEVDIVQVGVFSDPLAYGNTRGIYRIKDNVSGKSYLGISGIGIAETGSHSTGKQNVADER